VRLQHLQARYGDRIRPHWRGVPLLPGERPGRVADAHTLESRQQAAAQEPCARFVLPALGAPLPASSLPALIAAKGAAQQGLETFEAFHTRLFAAHFHEHADISQPDTLLRLAGEVGVDVQRLAQDCAGDRLRQAVLEDWAEAVAWFGVSALPTVIFEEKIALVGVRTIEEYAAMLGWCQSDTEGHAR